MKIAHWYYCYVDWNTVITPDIYSSPQCTGLSCSMRIIRYSVRYLYTRPRPKGWGGRTATYLWTKNNRLSKPSLDDYSSASLVLYATLTQVAIFANRQRVVGSRIDGKKNAPMESSFLCQLALLFFNSKEVDMGLVAHFLLWSLRRGLMDGKRCEARVCLLGSVQETSWRRRTHKPQWICKIEFYLLGFYLSLEG